MSGIDAAAMCEVPADRESPALLCGTLFPNVVERGLDLLLACKPPAAGRLGCLHNLGASFNLLWIGSRVLNYVRQCAGRHLTPSVERHVNARA